MIITYYNREIKRRGSSKEVIDDVMYKIYKKARDNSRTPMQVRTSRYKSNGANLV